MNVTPRNEGGLRACRKRLRLLKREHGMTTEAMAARCGLPKRTLDRFLDPNSPSAPGFHQILALADGMQVSIDWICGRTAVRMVRHSG